MQEPKFSLGEFTPDEAKSVTADIDAVLAKYQGQFSVTPMINTNGTIGAKLELFKKVELVPKEGVPSPFVNGEQSTPETA